MQGIVRCRLTARGQFATSSGVTFAAFESTGAASNRLPSETGPAG
jgi:hypothetical protein